MNHPFIPNETVIHSVKKKHGFNWKRTLKFTVIYIICSVIGAIAEEYSPFIHTFLFSLATVFALFYFLNVKKGENVWDYEND